MRGGHSMAERWPEFVSEYEHHGKKWCLNIPAQSWEDAEARAESIRKTFQVLGKLEGEIPVSDEEGEYLAKMFRASQ
jgi:hypothetical protein